jgi:hypothetical protein
MRFLLITTRTYYDEYTKEKLEKLGFEFYFGGDSGRGEFVMTDRQVFIEFESLQQLVDFTTYWGEITINEDVIKIDA